MSQLSYTNFVDGDQPTASGFNTRFLLAINLLNSGIESDNIASSAITAAKISSSAVTTSKLSHPVLFVESSSIASAGTTDLATATGNCVDITGTTTITAFGTLQAGTVMFLRFTGALTLTHNATSLILPSSANITTVNGDVAIMRSLGSGNWKCLSYSKQDGTAVVGSTVGNSVQVVNTTVSSVATGTTTTPWDDSIPQNTEGTEFMSLAITPSSATNKLKISVTVVWANSIDETVTWAIHQDSTANALLAVTDRNNNAGAPNTTTFTHYMTSGTTSSTTFKIRGGPNASGTLTFNGAAGARKLGGISGSSITITEIKV